MSLFVMSIYPLSNEIKVRHDLLLRQLVEDGSEPAHSRARFGGVAKSLSNRLVKGYLRLP